MGLLALPIDGLIPDVVAAVAARGAVVLTAPPGSGKSTRVPPALVAGSPGTVLLLQPRRIAAVTLARRIAHERGWQVGREIGHQVRFDKQGGRDTRLWVMTEGVLTRRITEDALLDGVGTVILDEFHERSLHADLALAWCAELRRTLRPDLRVVVMSATMDPAPVAAVLGGCPILDAPGRVFPVTTVYRDVPRGARLETVVAPAVAEALDDPEGGDVLVFLPGVGEIRACQASLEHLFEVDVLPLHGQLPPDQQERAFVTGVRRKVVLATNVAETSVTIPGVRTVIDSGLARIARVDADTGFDTLQLEGISRHSADQRAGRAGRTAPGRCVRLWSRLEDSRRDLATDPEIARVDLAGTVLALKAWHGADTRAFPWYQAPETERLAAAEDLLAMLDLAAAPFAALTARGQRLVREPLHPRLARLLDDARRSGQAQLGATLAALCSERDLRPPRRMERGAFADPLPSDVLDRLECLTRAERTGFHPRLRDEGIDPNAARDVARVRDELLRGATSDGRSAEWAVEHALVARLLLAAFPDRVAKRSAPDSNRCAAVGGVAMEIDRASGLCARPGQARPPLLLAYGVQGLARRGQLGQDTLVRQGAELDEEDLEAVFPGSVQRREQLTWNDQARRVDALVGWFYRDLCVRTARDGTADPVAVAAFLAQRLVRELPQLLAPDTPAGGWLQRYRWLRTVCPDLGLPARDDDDLVALLGDWCTGKRSAAEVEAVDKLPWLTAGLDFKQQRLIDEWAPEKLPVPSGSLIRLDYSDASPARPPVLAVRLQELFGLAATPTLAGGRHGVLLHLLGPNYRPEQITRDLAGFWATTYPQVRKDLRGRYPKHSWPDDPLAAAAVARGGVKR